MLIVCAIALLMRKKSVAKALDLARNSQPQTSLSRVISHVDNEWVTFGLTRRDA
jgi:hypothetical protein